MKSVVVVIFLLVGFSVGTRCCGTPQPPERQWIRHESELDFTSLIQIPRVQANFDLWYSSALVSTGDLWAVGGWNAPVNYIYKWSVKDQTWRSIKTPSFFTTVSARIFFLNPQVGWIIDRNVIVRTQDGGENWRVLSLEGKSKITKLQAIYFPNPESGFVGGTTGYMDRSTFEPVHGIEILCTGDGGGSFQTCYKDTNKNTVYSITKLNDGAVGVFSDNTLLVTDYKGKTWTEKKLPITVNALSTDNRGAIWIIGNEGDFLSSTDLGNSWNRAKFETESFPRNQWNSIAFSQFGFGIAVGDRGAVAFTADGHNWRLAGNSKIQEDLYSVQIIDSKLVIQGRDNIFILGVRHQVPGTGNSN